MRLLALEERVVPAVWFESDYQSMAYAGQTAWVRVTSDQGGSTPAGEVTWGDGSAASTFSGSDFASQASRVFTHSYSSEATFDAKLWVGGVQIGSAKQITVPASVPPPLANPNPDDCEEPTDDVVDDEDPNCETGVKPIAEGGSTRKPDLGSVEVGGGGMFTHPPPGETIDPGFTVRPAPCDPPGASGQEIPSVSEGPVRYADGVVQLGYTDLASAGFGLSWAQGRSWTNGPGYAKGGDNGNGWVSSGLPSVVQGSDSKTFAVVSNGTTARTFVQVGSSSTYAEQFGQGVLTYYSTPDEFVLTTQGGVQWRFAAFGGGHAAQKKGQFISRTDASNVVTSVHSRDGDGRVTEVRRGGGTTGMPLESWTYAYDSTILGVKYLTAVSLRRQKVGDSSWATARKAEYEYYGASESFGNAGDLKRVTLRDGANAVLGRQQYRYYLPGDTKGYVGGLKYVVGYSSYDRLVGDGHDPATVGDATLGLYADKHFEYDALHRVVLERVQGDGCSSCSGGIGEYTFAYEKSSHAAGHNSWAVKTTETLPDGNRKVVFSNAYAQIMLAVTQEVINGATQREWRNFNRFDSAGRVTLSAGPVTVTGHDTASADLLNYNSTTKLFDHLHDTAGPVVITEYGIADTAGATTPGDLNGYLKKVSLRKGETGADVPQTARQYYTQTANGQTVHPTATVTVYPEGSDTSALNTTFAYTYSGSGILETMTVTRPYAKTEHNGPGSTASMTHTIDSYGRVRWTKDEANFITYREYDDATGAVVKRIDDVQTSKTGDYSGSAPWTTQSGAGLHRITSAEIDRLGRATKVTDPAGTVSYTVYKDAAREVRVYPGWAGSAPTGPVQIWREDREKKYLDSLTGYTTSLGITDGRPDGSEAVTSYVVLTLNRQRLNVAGQPVQNDAYFSFTGLSVNYATASSYGTEGTNFYRTLADFADRGWLKRTQTATGTITRYVHDVVGRVVEVWVGTDDSPTAGFWSPANTHGTDLVKVNAAVYDTGGVGDGLLTAQVSYPGATAPIQTVYAYDWRDRPVAVKPGVAAAASGTPTVGLTGTAFDVTEPFDGAASAVVYVWVGLSAIADHPVTLSYATTGVTATSGADFTATSGTLTIPAGAPGAAVGVPVLADTTGSEAGETFTLTLSSPSGANLGSATATITVRDQDTPESTATLRFAAPALTVSEFGGYATVTLNKPVTGATVKFQLIAGSASAGTDFLADLGGHTFAANETSFTFPLSILQDVAVEGSETLTLQAYGATSITLAGGGSTLSINLTILDDDFAVSAEDDAVNRQSGYTVYDNLSRAIEVRTYDGDTVNIATDSGGDGVPDPPAAARLRSKAETKFDDRGQVWRTLVYSVDSADGTVGRSLTTDTWHDRRGLPVKTAAPGGLVRKVKFDGLGRAIATFAADGGGDSSWSAAFDVVGDIVYEQTATEYDLAGNVLKVTSKVRFHDATGTGELADKDNQPKARISYAGFYYDVIHRPTATVNVGTNGGSAWTRPSSAPSRSDTVLVSSQSYDSSGWVSSTIDPRGIETRTIYDRLGRVVKTVQAYVDGTVSAQDDKTTEFVYDGSSHVTAYKAWLNSSTVEVTEYDYGVVAYVGGQYVSSNDLLEDVLYPDIWSPSARPKQFEYVYDALGRRVKLTDANGTVHEYGFDAVGRSVNDAAVTLGGGVSNAVLRLDTAYDTAGRAYKFTSYSKLDASAVYNEVQREFNGFGQVTKEYQNTTAAVNTGTAPYVAYGYDTSGNASRLTSMTYPSGQVLSYTYDGVSRLSGQSYAGSAIEEYQYLGLGTTVRRTQTAASLRQSLYGGSSDSGDQYDGFDRFGRVVNLVWEATNGTDVEALKYGYDRGGNRLYRTREANHAFDELYHASGKTTDTDRYDRLAQLTGFARGTLSDSNSDGVLDTVSSASRTQGWTFDGLGNFPTVTTGSATQTRTHDLQNRLTTLVDGSTTTTLTYDKAGNLTTNEQGNLLGYDAWNRLVAFNESVYFRHDALGRRNRVFYSNGSNSTRNLYYTTGWQVAEERGVSGSFTRHQYVWTPAYVDGLVARLTDAAGDGTFETRHYALTDANWNVVAITDSAGAVLERFVADPYGRVDVYSADFSTHKTGGSDHAWDYFHQGGRYDYATGLFHFRNRDYSPTLMRWVSMDPIGLIDANDRLYGYVSNNPVLSVDPLGLEKDFLHGQDWRRDEEIRKKEEERIRRERNDKLSKRLDALDCCPSDKKEKAKAVLTKVLNASDFFWPWLTGPFGFCDYWAKNHAERVAQLSQELNEVRDCLKVDPIFVWNVNTALGRGSGAQHVATRITLCNGEEYYLDDGYYGGPDHLFEPKDVPGYYVPHPGIYYYPPRFCPPKGSSGTPPGPKSR